MGLLELSHGLRGTATKDAIDSGRRIIALGHQFLLQIRHSLSATALLQGLWLLRLRCGRLRRCGRALGFPRQHGQGFRASYPIRYQAMLVLAALHTSESLRTKIAGNGAIVAVRRRQLLLQCDHVGTRTTLPHHR
jgi:hypothetical protein